MVSNGGSNGNYAGQWDDSDTGARSCAVGRHCGEADFAGNPQLGPRAFCTTDERRIGEAVRDLPGRYVELHAKLGEKSQGDGIRVAGGDTSAPLPLNPGVDEFLRYLELVVLTWEERVRTAQGLSNPDSCPFCRGDGCHGCAWSGVRRWRPGEAVDRACRLLGSRIPALLSLPPDETVRPLSPEDPQHPGSVLFADSSGDWYERRPMDGTDAGLEFLALNGKMRGRLGLNLRSERVPVPCPACGMLALKQRETPGGGLEDLIRCSDCGTRFIGDELGAIVEAYRAAREEQAKAS